MRLRLFSKREGEKIAVSGTPLLLVEPSLEHQTAWIGLRRESRDFLRQWEPAWPVDDLTRTGYGRRLRSYLRQRKNGTGRTYFLIDGDSNTLLGGVSLTRIRAEGENSAILGYWMGKPHAGNGHMSLALPALLEHAFTQLELGRVNAACLPHNIRSISLLRKCGFVETGFVPRYLEINGTLSDHVLFACHRDSVLSPVGEPVENTGKSISRVV